jgi:GNAT superfamily N-acetyltransferase
MTIDAPAGRVVRLAWDSDHFGVTVGRLEGGREDLGGTLAEADAGGVQLLIARADARDTALVQSLEAHRFRLTDTLVRYERTLDAVGGVPAVVRPARATDAPAVEAVAAEAFAGYPGHFRNDARLDPRRADLVYVRWAAGACQDQDPASAMFVAEEGGRAAGFGLVQRAAPGTAEGALYGVSRAARGRRLGGALLAATMEWAKQGRFERMTVYSSLANPAAHRVWIAAGFAPAGGLHTLHRWSEPER